MTPAIRLRGLTRDFGGARAVDSVDLDVQPGEAIALMGATGAGRTTLLLLIATLLRPTAGEITLAGVNAVRDPLAARRHVLYVVPGTPCGAGLSVAEYLGVLAQSPRARRAPRRLALDELSQRARLDPDTDVDRLGPGARWRLAMAALLILCPPVALLDEPLAGVDSDTQRFAGECVTDLRRNDAAIVSAVSAPDDAAAVADVAIGMGRGRLSLRSALSPRNERLSPATGTTFAGAV